MSASLLPWFGPRRKKPPGSSASGAGWRFIDMRAKFILGGLAALFATTALAQTPSTDLAKPPSGARHFIIESTGGKHGDAWTWTAADGARMARETWNLRGQAFDSDMAGRS